jgi:hypothetical protein
MAAVGPKLTEDDADRLIDLLRAELRPDLQR